jgi:hypothetical protein
VPADDGGDVCRQPAEDFGPALETGVDHDDFGVVARCRVAAQYLPEPPDLQRLRQRQRREQVDMLGAELGGRPVRDLVADVVCLPARQLDQLPIGVAAHPGNPVAEAEQPIKNFAGLRPRRDVPGEHDAVRVLHRGLRERGLERGQYSVDVGQDSN